MSWRYAFNPKLRSGSYEFEVWKDRRRIAMWYGPLASAREVSKIIAPLVIDVYDGRDLLGVLRSGRFSPV